MNNITPLKAIRKKCFECSNGQNKEIRDCPCFENNGAIEKCSLYPYRLGKRPKINSKNSALKSIRKYCLWCCNGNKRLVKECSIEDCPLWIYRFGKNPHRKGIGGSLKYPFYVKT
jgi:hypothetical protein